MTVAQKCTVARRQVDKFFLQGSGQYLKEESFVLEKLRVIFLTAVWTHGLVMWPIKKWNCSKDQIKKWSEKIVKKLNIYSTQV